MAKVPHGSKTPVESNSESDKKTENLADAAALSNGRCDHRPWVLGFLGLMQTNEWFTDGFPP